jgi:hypothetical protein
LGAPLPVIACHSDRPPLIAPFFVSRT